MRKKAQVLFTLLVFFLAAGTAVGHKVYEVKKSKVQETPTHYLDGGVCQSCIDSFGSSQTCSETVTSNPCLCTAASGTSQAGSIVNARVTDNCVQLYRQN